MQRCMWCTSVPSSPVFFLYATSCGTRFPGRASGQVGRLSPAGIWLEDTGWTNDWCPQPSSQIGTLVRTRIACCEYFVSKLNKLLVFSVLLCQSQNAQIKCTSPKDEGLMRTTRRFGCIQLIKLKCKKMQLKCGNIPHIGTKSSDQ